MPSATGDRASFQRQPKNDHSAVPPLAFSGRASRRFQQKLFRLAIYLGLAWGGWNYGGALLEKAKEMLPPVTVPALPAGTSNKGTPTAEPVSTAPTPKPASGAPETEKQTFPVANRATWSEDCEKRLGNCLGVSFNYDHGDVQRLRQELDMVKAAGIDTIRFDVFWHEIEPTRGNITDANFAKYDQLVNEATERGLQVLMILDYGNTAYSDISNGFTPNVEENLTAFGNYASAVTNRYKHNQNVFWEIWNEPNHPFFWGPKPDPVAYAELVKRVVPIIRENNPDAVILAGAVTLDPHVYDYYDFLKQLFDQGIMDLVDGISIHPYRDPGLPPETAFADLARVRALINEHSPGKPIFDSEWGYSDFHLPEDVQAKYLIRRYLVSKGGGMTSGAIWHNWREGTNPDDPEHNFGMVDSNSQSTHAYEKLKDFMNQLKDMRLALKVSESPYDVWVFTDDDGNYKTVLWCTYPEQKEITFADGRVYTMTDDPQIVSGRPD